MTNLVSNNYYKHAMSAFFDICYPNCRHIFNDFYQLETDDLNWQRVFSGRLSISKDDLENDYIFFKTSLSLAPISFNDTFPGRTGYYHINIEADDLPSNFTDFANAAYEERNIQRNEDVYAQMAEEIATMLAPDFTN